MDSRPLRTILVLSPLLVLPALAGVCGAQTIDRVSHDLGWGDADGPSTRPMASGDGRFVVFASEATDLVAGDTNGVSDIFVLDRDTGAIERVSVGAAGIQANGASDRPSISNDGRLVTFNSEATNLVANDTNGLLDVFLHDRQTGITLRASVASGGGEANGPSLRARVAGEASLVVFESDASNLVAEDTNGVSDIFVHDVVAGTTTRVSVDSTGIEGNGASSRPRISDDGRVVAFESDSDNLAGGDSNGQRDVFAHDRQSGSTVLVSVNPDGASGNGRSDQPAISGDGRVTAFRSQASDLVADDGNGASDVFVRDRTTRTTTRVSVASSGAEGNADSASPDLSFDGRLVVFTSEATNLDDRDACCRDIFLHDLDAGTTARISEPASGDQANGGSDDSAISSDGRFVVFASEASNLVPGDGNGLADVFLADRDTSLADCQGIDGEVVLFVNGQSGGGDGFTVPIHDGHPLVFTIVRPSGGGNGRFFVHLNAGAPDPSTVTVLPQSLGPSCFPFVLPDANPSAVWNNVGKTDVVGSSRYFASEIPDPPLAPVSFLVLSTGDPGHFPVGTSWTLQGAILNPAGSAQKPASVTNAVSYVVLP
jgi:Tol biopolymer transport system component